MTRTNRKKHTHHSEPGFIRTIEHRKYRHLNKNNILKSRDVEKEPNTGGYIYW